MTKTRENEFGDQETSLKARFLGQIFFRCNECLHQLDSIVVYHNMQNQEKLMTQTRKNGLKPSVWAILSPFGPILGREFFFSKIGLCYSFQFTVGYLDAKNQNNLMMGSMRTGVADRRTDGRSWLHRTRRTAGRVQKWLTAIHQEIYRRFSLSIQISGSI